MERIQITPRPHWETQVESLGFNFHSINNEVYWDERVCYHFEAREIDVLEKATNEIEKLCMELVDQVVAQHRYHELNIPECAWDLIESSWKNWDTSICGRLDFSYNGTEPPKLLEYNGDTPVCLLEASLIQKQWLEQVRPNDQQFNTLHERLVATWLKQDFNTIHLACRAQYPEMSDTIEYLAKTINQAGLNSKRVHIDNIAWNGSAFVDEEHEVINTLFKLFPWGWMIEEVFSRVEQSNTLIFEPAWKMILSNKGMMVLLWEMFPGHPNLLPSYFNLKKLSGDYVKKPLLGRGGNTVSLHTDKETMISNRSLIQGPFMFQQAHLPPNFDGNYAVIGSWIIAGKSAGVGIREDITPLTNADSRFVPHFFN
jgi:glutathionylspermidine synthase